MGSGEMILWTFGKATGHPSQRQVFGDRQRKGHREPWARCLPDSRHLHQWQHWGKIRSRGFLNDALWGGALDARAHFLAAWCRGSRPVTAAALTPGGPQGGCNPFTPYCRKVTLWFDTLKTGSREAPLQWVGTSEWQPAFPLTHTTQTGAVQKEGGGEGRGQQFYGKATFSTLLLLHTGRDWGSCLIVSSNN